MFQFVRVKERMSVQEELDQLMFLTSDQSLSLLPEYHQRIQVRFLSDVLVLLLLLHHWR